MSETAQENKIQESIKEIYHRFDLLIEILALQEERLTRLERGSDVS